MNNFIYIKDTGNYSFKNEDILRRIFGHYKLISPTGRDLFIYSTRLSGKAVFENSNYLTFIQGYIRDPALKLEEPLEVHIKSFTDYLFYGLSDINEKFSGLFSSFSLDKNSGNIILATDWTALYPVYYFIDDGHLAISSSIYALADFFSLEPDMVGIAQRIASKKPYNYGRRTIVRKVKRLLWSEKIIINDSGIKGITQEKGLYRIDHSDILSQSAHIWTLIKNEFELALRFNNSIYISQSGGIDSRLTLGAVPKKKKITCLTYGNEEYYESKIAQKCARVRNAKHNCFSVFGNHFPSKAVMLDYLTEGEPFINNNLFSILESFSKADEVLLLGDMCEAITGRKITNLRTRQNQIKSAFRQIVLKRPVKLTSATSELIKRWELEMLQKIYADFDGLNFSKFNLTKDDLIDATSNDLQEEFSFIRFQEIPYIELLDECFNWLHHEDGYQTLHYRSKFDAIPLMSSNKVLQATSAIHPDYRLNNRIIDIIFRNYSELGDLASIPLSHTPGIKLSAPNFIKLPLWAIRSRADNFLIRRMMHKKNPNMRYRLMKSLDWPKIYQNENMLVRLSEWFSENYLGLRDETIKAALSRKNLKHWPVVTYDIVSLAVLELQYGLLISLKNH